MVGLIGSLTGTTMAFIFPGMLALRDPVGGPGMRGFAWQLLLWGVLLSVIGVVFVDQD